MQTIPAQLYHVTVLISNLKHWNSRWCRSHCDGHCFLFGVIVWLICAVFQRAVHFDNFDNLWIAKGLVVIRLWQYLTGIRSWWTFIPEPTMKFNIIGQKHWSSLHESSKFNCVVCKRFLIGNYHALSPTWVEFCNFSDKPPVLECFHTSSTMLFTILLHWLIYTSHRIPFKTTNHEWWWRSGDVVLLCNTS